MKKQFLQTTFVIVTALALLTACRKNKEDTAQPLEPDTPLCKLTSLLGFTSGDSIVHVYDTQGRLSKTIYFDREKNLLSRYVNYTYEANKITHTFYDAGNIHSQTTYTINSDGTVAYQTQKYGDSRDLYMQYDTTCYTYNSQGYNTLIVYKAYGETQQLVSRDTTWNTFTDGNLTSARTKKQSG